MRSTCRIFVATILLVSLLLVCGGSAPVRAQAAPGPFVKQAFDLLMDRFVVPPTSATLLAGGWDGALAFLKDATGTKPNIGGPPFRGDRNADWGAFQDAYPQLVAVGGAALDQHALDYAIVDGMAKSLNSTHTNLNPSALGGGQACGGVGLQISMELIVTEVFPGTPAEAGGVKFGDRIAAVDGVSVEGLTSMETSTKVRGPVGSSVQITVQRASEAEPITLTMTRDEISAPWVTARVVDGGIGILRIRNFPMPEAIGQFDQAVAMLDGADIRALVIDLRGNGGGFYSTAHKVISRFVRSGAIYQSTNRQGQSSTTNADGSAWGRDIPIAVVVNSGTGSGAELLAVALRENVGGFLVGGHTRGALGNGTPFPLTDGSTLVIATASGRSGKGQEIEHIGLEPDQIVDLDLVRAAQGDDSQLEAATNYLRGKAGL